MPNIGDRVEINWNQVKASMKTELYPKLYKIVTNHSKNNPLLVTAVRDDGWVEINKQFSFFVGELVLITKDGILEATDLQRIIKDHGLIYAYENIKSASIKDKELAKNWEGMLKSYKKFMDKLILG